MKHADSRIALTQARECNVCWCVKPNDQMVAKKWLCKVCKNERARTYVDSKKAGQERRKAKRNANLEAAREAERQYNLRNRDRINASVRAARAKDPERHRKYARDYYRRNPAKALIPVIRRLTKRYLATPPWADSKAINAIYRDARERRAWGEEVEVDHCIPLQGDLVSGLHVQSNLKIRSKKVNRLKQNKFCVDWDWELVDGYLDVML